MLIAGRNRLVGLIGTVILGLTIGLAQGTIFRQSLAFYKPLEMQKITLQVTADEDAVYGKNSQLTFVAVDIINDGSGQKLPGKIELSGFGPAAVFQGDTVLASGKLYPGIGAYQGFMSYADLQVIQHHPTIIASLRRRFAAGMQTALPEPLASFAMGLLIGQRATLPDDVKQNLLMVGLTHIIAVSGYNLTIMLDASRKILGKQSKRLSTLLSLTLMILFVLLAGSSASIIRAAIVSSLSMAAAYYGRKTRPLLLIMLAAAITAWLNPLYIWGDTSWYLSFLAFYGVMLVSPLLQNRLPKIVHNSTVLAVGLESICAEIMSVPFILFTFGQMSFIGLPANMLVVTLVPLAMLLSLIAGLAGMLAFSIAGWLAWPAKLLLTYMLDTAHLLADVPHIFKENVWLSLRGLILLYIVIAVMTALLWLKDRESDTITDRKPLDSS